MFYVFTISLDSWWLLWDFDWVKIIVVNFLSLYYEKIVGMNPYWSNQRKDGKINLHSLAYRLMILACLLWDSVTLKWWLVTSYDVIWLWMIGNGYNVD